MFETAMFSELLAQFCQRAHQNSKDKGFWGMSDMTATSFMGKPVAFTPPPPNYGEKYMLMVSELSELFEAHRKGKLTAPCDKPCHLIDPKATEPIRVKCQMCAGSGQVSKVSFIHGKYTDRFGNEVEPPQCDEKQVCPTCAGQGLVSTTGIRPLTNEEEEIADLVIRVADYCGYRNIDLGAAIIAKMKYNATRPYMHGKSC